MKKISIYKTISLIYPLILALFIGLSIFIIKNDKINIYNDRLPEETYLVRNIHYTLFDNEEAPLGIQKEYYWDITVHEEVNDECVAFYTSFHLIDVYIDDELVYRLTLDDENSIAHSTSSNWVTIPLYPRDNGKVIRVVLTPLFEDALKKEIYFLMGSNFAILFKRLIDDSPILVLSVFSILLGIAIIVSQMGLSMVIKSKEYDNYYLASLAILLGIWKLTDTHFSPILFSNHTMILGYISVGVIFVGAIPLLLFMKNQFMNTKTRLLDMTLIIHSIACLIIIYLQVTNHVEIRELLSLSHILLLISVLVIIATLIIKTDYILRNKKSFIMLNLGITLLIGVIMDLIAFYISNSSSRVFFTLLSYIIFTIGNFIISIFNANKKSYTDAFTGLNNKAYFDAEMNMRIRKRGSVSIMVFDLNNLKYVNDNFGHEVGDQLIYNFSMMLKKVFPQHHSIIRWGGDEFVVIAKDIKDTDINTYIQKLNLLVDEHNSTQDKIKISYALGYAISTNHPGLSRYELFEIADKRMYQDKNAWYESQEA